MPGDFIEDIAGEALEKVASRISRVRAVRRFRKTNKADCAVRALGQNVRTIMPEWLYGEATVKSGQLTFQRRDTGETVGPLRVTRLDESQMRLSPLRDHCVVVRVITDDGELEWDLLAELLDEAAPLLGQS